ASGGGVFGGVATSAAVATTQTGLLGKSLGGIPRTIGISFVLIGAAALTAYLLKLKGELDQAKAEAEETSQGSYRAGRKLQAHMTPDEYRMYLEKYYHGSPGIQEFIKRNELRPSFLDNTTFFFRHPTGYDPTTRENLTQDIRQNMRELQDPLQLSMWIRR